MPSEFPSDDVGDAYAARTQHRRPTTEGSGEEALASPVLSMIEGFPSSPHEAMLRLASDATGLNVPKSAKNPQGNYKYASHDDVKRAVSAIAGPLGLRPRIRCTHIERKAAEWGKQVAIERYTFDCYWVWGMVRASDPQPVTISVYASGAQSFGAAQSYAHKEWLKSDLQIDTGDPDADHHVHTVEPERAVAEPKRGWRTVAAAKNELLEALGRAAPELQDGALKEYAGRVWREAVDHADDEHRLRIEPLGDEGQQQVRFKELKAIIDALGEPFRVDEAEPTAAETDEREAAHAEGMEQAEQQQLAADGAQAAAEESAGDEAEKAPVAAARAALRASAADDG